MKVAVINNSRTNERQFRLVPSDNMDLLALKQEAEKYVKLVTTETDEYYYIILDKETCEDVKTIFL